eukprot:scaffold8374_cov175-Amphora_coffeaeformis.AAC.108
MFRHAICTFLSRSSVGQNRLAGLALSKLKDSFVPTCSLLRASPRSLTTSVDEKGTTDTTAETAAPEPATTDHGSDGTSEPRSATKNDTGILLLKNTGVAKGASTLLPCSFSLGVPTDRQKDLMATTVASRLESLTEVAKKETEIAENESDESKIIRPIASNRTFKPESFRAAMVPRPTVAPGPPPRRPAPTKKPPKKPKQQPKRTSWGNHIAKNGVRVTFTPWIHIHDIPPNSSMEAMMDAVEKVLDKELERGIVNLDAPFVPQTAAPMLRFTDEERAIRKKEYPHPYITEARLILSPFARPTGWYVRLVHRSLAQALLVRSRKGKHLLINSKIAKVKEYKPALGGPEFEGNLPGISDATIRVENCPFDLQKINFLNFFSRFDLSMTTESIVPWQGVTPEGKEASSQTYLVHFADPSWARAAIRERQGAELSGIPVRLVQFPRQLFQENKI